MIPAARNSAKHAVLVAALLSSSAAFISPPALADQSMEELEARLEKAKKRNLMLKAELLERENTRIETEALEKENARLEGLMKSSKTQQANGAVKATEAPRAISAGSHTERVERRVASRSVVERPSSPVDPKRTINKALAAMPPEDPRRQFIAADMRSPSYKEPPAIVDYWNGAYAGVNVGYTSGGSRSSHTYSTPITDTFGSIPGFPIGGVNQTLNVISAPNLFATTLATSGQASINQSGLVGGLQGGWNVRLFQSIVAGVEADIQGSTIQGAGSYDGYPVSQNAAFEITTGDCPTCTISRYNINQNVLGGGKIKSGINWLGTVRGRIGWLPWESLMVYATGGLAYSDAYADAAHELATANVIRVSGAFSQIIPSGAASAGGLGRYNGIRVGWVAGGGLEWMFTSNWSVKAEGLYYDLGHATFRSSAVGVPYLNANIPTTTVGFDGAIGRLGLNYHFVQAAAPVSARY